MSATGWKTILAVVTDPFAREQTVAMKAAAIARRSGARLILFNAFMLPQPVSDVPMGSSDRILASAIRQRRERLEKLASALRLRSVKCVVHWDYPAHEAIIREVLAVKPDLLVTGSHRHGRLARMLLANTDWELMRACPCPMWFVRSKDLPRRPHVLVGVDPRHTHAKPSRLDDRLLQGASALTAQLGGTVSIVHAYEATVSAYTEIPMELMRLQSSVQRTRDFAEKTTRAVAKLAARYGIEAADCHVEEGITSEVIARLARRRDTDVLVLGAVSRSMLARPVIGSTAERVIDAVDCDLFVVKPAGFKTLVKRRRGKM